MNALFTLLLSILYVLNFRSIHVQHSQAFFELGIYSLSFQKRSKSWWRNTWMVPYEIESTSYDGYKFNQNKPQIFCFLSKRLAKIEWLSCLSNDRHDRITFWYHLSRYPNNVGLRNKSLLTMCRSMVGVFLYKFNHWREVVRYRLNYSPSSDCLFFLSQHRGMHMIRATGMLKDLVGNKLIFRA